ncbi:AzlC family ABC transporter permease [Shouchella lonarensis]|uniref:4-azaleucine resistance probable transporter AzlC n=1 Tax=Shouchella lonarensis TaxID=1464122 RepID=A0A1G6GJ47_9BACI|nr:AzlC family ABC transporter permease [Shouchella lonarensis]SDB81964.1 4-azaleucine resistance probable transporter AzlC [Shouchella lonarensis]
MDKNVPHNLFLQGTRTAIPIIIGYIPIAMTFGMLGVQAGISFWHVVMMSVLVFAGASQFVGLNLIAAGTGSITIILTTFILNLRHFIMSMSFMHKQTALSTGVKALLSFGLTDETFAVASMENRQSGAFFIGLFFSSYAAWVGGTMIGGLLAHYIPPSVSEVMAITLYALFIGLLIPAIRQHKKVLIIVIPTAAICYMFHLILPIGWAIVLATVLGSSLGIFIDIEKEG